MIKHSAVQPDGTLAIPPALKEKFPAGTLFEWKINDDGAWTLKADGDVGKDAWFWTPKWQEGEHRAQQDIDAGRWMSFSLDGDDDKELSAPIFYRKAYRENIDSGLDKVAAQEKAVKQLQDAGYTIELGPGYG